MAISYVKILKENVTIVVLYVYIPGHMVVEVAKINNLTVIIL